VSNTAKFARKEYIKTAASVALVVVVVLGLFFGLRIVLDSETPVRVVESGSMCVSDGSYCDGWSHIFDYTLHVGDTG